MSDARIRIYQNYFRADQVPLLDPGFTPHDWTHNPHPEYREIIVFLEAYRLGRHLEADYVGIVSWKFGHKTGLTAQQFLSFIEHNPGFDVYFINPFPEEPYRHFNVWTQAERVHPGSWQLAQDLFHAAGFDVDLAHLGRNDGKTVLYCNYWVGNKVFWDTYIAFIKPLFECVVHRLPEEVRSRYFSIAKHSEPIPFFPFIFERMFSTLLLINPDLKACPYRYPDETIRFGLDVKHVARCLERTVIDRADRTAFLRRHKTLHRILFERCRRGWEALLRAGVLCRKLLKNGLAEKESL